MVVCVLAGMSAVVAMAIMAVVVVVVDLAGIVGVMMVTIPACLFVPEAPPVAVCEMPLSDRVPVHVMMIRAAVTMSAAAAALALGMSHDRRKRKVSVHVNGWSDWRYREDEPQHTRRESSAP
jgi:hypothetical protein